jgi:hypothetical protein
MTEDEISEVIRKQLAGSALELSRLVRGGGFRVLPFIDPQP